MTAGDNDDMRTILKTNDALKNVRNINLSYLHIRTFSNSDCLHVKDLLRINFRGRSAHPFITLLAAERYSGHNHDDNISNQKRNGEEI